MQTGLKHERTRQDFNDWGFDPDGAAKAAASALTVSCRRAWEVSRGAQGKRRRVR